MVRGHSGTPARVCVVTNAVQHLCSGDEGGTTAFQRRRHHSRDDLVFLDEGSGGGPNETLLDRVRRAVRGMLYADDAGIVSRSPAGLARMTVIVEVFGAFGLTVSEKKTETLLMRAPEKAQQPGETPKSPLPALEIAAAGQECHQVH